MNSFHPYQNQKSIAFWSKSVSSGFNPREMLNIQSPLINKNEKVTSAGSCFAANLVPFIESAGIEYLRTEEIHPIFSNLGENLGYANFSARYGNVYTARQLRQLYERSLGIFLPIEDRWIYENQIIDPFRPGLKFPAVNEIEFDLFTSSHLSATKRAFENADVFVFTLGLTEAWKSQSDGAIYPACPGTIAGDFDQNRHAFHNFTVNEVIDDLSEFIVLLRRNNPGIKFILTVSPVPLVATATANHVVSSSIYSKSVLRVAAEEVSQNLPNIIYFPAYEIITGPQAPHDFFESDRRNVSKAGIEEVMKTFLSLCEEKSKSFNLPFTKRKDRDARTSVEDLSKKISQIECDEVMVDDTLAK